MIGNGSIKYKGGVGLGRGLTRRRLTWLLRLPGSHDYSDLMITYVNSKPQCYNIARKYFKPTWQPDGLWYGIIKHWNYVGQYINSVSYILKFIRDHVLATRRHIQLTQLHKWCEGPRWAVTWYPGYMLPYGPESHKSLPIALHEVGTLDYMRSRKSRSVQPIYIDQNVSVNLNWLTGLRIG